MIGFFLLAEGASPANSTSIFAPTSPPADSIRSLFILVLAITGVIFLIVELVLLYWQAKGFALAMTTFSGELEDVTDTVMGNWRYL